MLPLWYSEIYTEGLDPNARFPRDRYRMVRSELQDFEESGKIQFYKPEAIAADLVKLSHHPEYVQAFLNGSLDERAIRRIGLRPWTKFIVERTLVLTNGTVSAVRHVMESGGTAGNLGGGTHHAYSDFGSGYCIFNDLAIAARVAQRDYEIARVLIFDLDVHQGDGTAAIFEDDPSVRTVSFHCAKNFPFRKMTSDRDVVFDEGVGDDFYLSCVEKALEAEIDGFEPQLILFQAGVDTLATDRLGHLELSRDGLKRRNQLVFQAAEKHDLPLVITMGGGYGEPIETSVRAHVDLFRGACCDT